MIKKKQVIEKLNWKKIIHYNMKGIKVKYKQNQLRNENCSKYIWNCKPWAVNKRVVFNDILIVLVFFNSLFNFLIILMFIYF